MFNEMYCTYPKLVICLFVIPFSKRIDCCDVCCTQNAGWSAEELWLISQLGQQTFLFSKMCRPSLGPTKFPVQRALRALMQGPSAGGWNGAASTFSHMPLWHVQRHVCTYLEVVCIDGEGRGAVKTIRAVEVQLQLVLTSALGVCERLASRSGRFTLFLRIADFFIIFQVCYLQCLASCLHSLASAGF
jgi:hypothetical protein